VDVIELGIRDWMPIEQAVVDAGAARFGPVAPTAAAIAGSAVILFAPIFQGLAISLMAGEVASLPLSRMTVPITYFLTHRYQSVRIVQGGFVMTVGAFGAASVLNLAQSAFTGWCPMMSILRHAGVKDRSGLVPQARRSQEGERP
jgi:hypothetical protein